jgi:hypothetical protein
MRAKEAKGKAEQPAHMVATNVPHLLFHKTKPLPRSMQMTISSNIKLGACSSTTTSKLRNDHACCC